MPLEGRIMRSTRLFAAILLAVTLGCSQEFTMDTELASLVETERAFSRHSVQNGMRDAFLTYLSEESIVFDPRPANGREVHAGREESGGTLIWWPVWAEISSAGDMGYTTGPWEFRRVVEGDTVVGYGHYVSVWRKEPDGSWRVAIDAGNAYGRPETVHRDLAVPDYHRPTVEDLSAAQVSAAHAALLKEEKALSDLSASKDAAEALAAHALEGIRLYRMGAYPALGKEALRTELSGTEGRLIWQPMEAVVSASADLGYTYGISRLEAEGAGPEEFSYLRIWKRHPGGSWRVALDLASPIGEEEPP
jgi:ketosteroid isomerase-like protein